MIEEIPNKEDAIRELCSYLGLFFYNIHDWSCGCGLVGLKYMMRLRETVGATLSHYNKFF